MSFIAGAQVGIALSLLPAASVLNILRTRVITCVSPRQVATLPHSPLYHNSIDGETSTRQVYVRGRTAETFAGCADGGGGGASASRQGVLPQEHLFRPLCAA